MPERMEKAIKSYFTVSALTGEIKRRLTVPDLRYIWVLGEITDLKYFTRGRHAYFSLKDENAVISCVFFAGNNFNYRGTLENGMKVFAYGSIDVYAPRGNYQLIIRQIIPSGEGEFALKIKKLEEKFKKEGLFDRKRPVPELPETIGLITSKDGAAIKDFLKMTKEVPYLKVILYPALVQGDEAPLSIINGIKKLNEIDEIEVIVITRGGGSEEDLRCFYDEGLVRAIYNSKKPVISAIGHERDVVFTDRVADLRKATPTDAGKFFAEAYKKTLEKFSKLSTLLNKRMALWAERSPETEKLKLYASKLKYLSDSILALRYQQLDYLNENLTKSIGLFLNDREQKVKHLSLRIHPKTLIKEFETKVERVFSLKLGLKSNIEKKLELRRSEFREFNTALKVNAKTSLKESDSKLQKIRHKLNAELLFRDIENKRDKVLYIKKAINKSIEGNLKEKQNAIFVFSEKLNDLSPLSTVARGFAIVKNNKGQVVKSVKNIKLGDFIEVNLKDGSIDCQVKDIKDKER